MKGGDYMAKKYNLGSSSDMRRFTRDLEKEVIANAKDQIHNSSFDAKCPNCKESIKVTEGLNICDRCQHKFVVDYKINFSSEN